MSSALLLLIALTEGMVATVVSSGIVYIFKVLYQMYAPLVVAPVAIVFLILLLQHRGKKATLAVVPLLSPKPAKTGKPKPSKSRRLMKPEKPDKRFTKRKLALQDVKVDEDAIIEAEKRALDEVVKNKLDDINDFFAYNMSPDDIDNISVRGAYRSPSTDEQGNTSSPINIIINILLLLL